MKNERGITLISLGIAITVLLIISSMVYTISISSLELGKKTAYTLELEVMQVEVDRLNSLMLNGKTYIFDGEEYVGEDIAMIGEELEDAHESILTSLGYEIDGYRYLSLENLEKIGVEGLTQGILLNITARDVVATIPYMDKDEAVYTLEQLGRGKYVVQAVEEEV